MQRKYFLQLFLVSFGIALLFAGLFFDMSTAVAQDATPTPDRLAQPTLPAVPSQADQGSQVFWLSCLPCHGDRGQGLTQEFIQVYPAEDRNCWNSGCHGKRPYENGFTIPEYIPPVIGADVLQKFSNAETLHAYISAAMPYWRPGSLTEEESWQVTAFILRQSGVWDAHEELNASNAAEVLIIAPTATPIPPGNLSSASIPVFAVLGGTILLVILFFVLQWKRKK